MDWFGQYSRAHSKVMDGEVCALSALIDKLQNDLL
jgi:hypothetical protein